MSAYALCSWARRLKAEQPPSWVEGLQLGVILSPLQLGLYWLITWSVGVLVHPLSLSTKLSGVALEVGMWVIVGMTAMMGFFGVLTCLMTVLDKSGAVVGRRVKVGLLLLGVTVVFGLGFAVIRWDRPLALCVLLPPFVLAALGVVFYCRLLGLWGIWIVLETLALGGVVGASIGLLTSVLGGSNWDRVLACFVATSCWATALAYWGHRTCGRVLA